MKATAMNFLLCIFSFCAQAQGENNNWCFGDRMGLNFNTSPPSFFQNSIRAMQSPMAVSDAGGRLLFYTSGTVVWDRQHNVMPNGSGLTENGIVVNNVSHGLYYTSVCVVPSPINVDHYYIVSTTENRYSRHHKAYYSLVDMSLNNGLGDVVDSMKDIVFATGVTEGVTTTGMGGDCLGHWVVVHQYAGSDYLAFKIDRQGFSSTPVISSGKQAIDDSIHYGIMAFNPAGNRLLRSGTERYQYFTGDYIGTLEMAAFDNVSGIFSGFEIIDTQNVYTYLAFSPDGSKLYIEDTDTSIRTNAYCQYDLSLLPNINAFRNSKTVLGRDSIYFSQGRLAPDGKIYVLPYGRRSFASVNYPDRAGFACEYVEDVISIPSLGFGQAGRELGANVVVNRPYDTVATPGQDVVLCYPDSVTIVADSAYSSCLWNNRSTQRAMTLKEPGTYIRYAIKDCIAFIDTFHVRLVHNEIYLGEDTAICAGASIALNVKGGAQARYQWQDGTTQPGFRVDRGGVFYVTVTEDGCISSDTLAVTVIEPKVHILEPDTTLCRGDSLVLHATAFPESHFYWNTGQATASLVTQNAGTYRVEASNICGSFSDSVTITEEICSCALFIPNAFSPNGDGQNDFFSARFHCPGLHAYRLQVYNRYGQKLFESTDPARGWNGGNADAGTYFFQLVYKDAGGKVYSEKGDIVLIR